MKTTATTPDPYTIGRLIRANGTNLSKALELAPWVSTHEARTLLAAGWLAEPIATLNERGQTKDPMAPAWVLVPRAALERYVEAYDDLSSLAGTMECDGSREGCPEEVHYETIHRCAPTDDEDAIASALEA